MSDAHPLKASTEELVIKILRVRCDHCNHVFDVIDIEPLPDTMPACRCKRCNYRYVKVDGVWYDEKILELWKKKVR